MTEQVIRLDNGFPTTIEEKAEFDRKQEYNVRHLLCLFLCAARPIVKPVSDCDRCVN